MAHSLSVSPAKSPLMALDNVAVPLARLAPPERAAFVALTDFQPTYGWRQSQDDRATPASYPEIEGFDNLAQDRRIPMTDQVISPLRRRMIEDMAIRKFAPKTEHD
jgi:hypothetical protein